MKIFIVLLLSCCSLQAQTKIVNASIKNAIIGQVVPSGGGSGTVFVTGTAGGSSRSDFSGNVGYAFTALANATVTDLGRFVLSGNTATHNVYLIHFTATPPTTGTIIATATAVPTSGITANTYSFVSVTPASIVSGDLYAIVSAEVSAGDAWLNDNQTTTTTGVGAIQGSMYDAGGGAYAYNTLSLNRAFVPTNMKYTIP